MSRTLDSGPAFETPDPEPLAPQDLSWVIGGGYLGWGLKALSYARRFTRIASPTIGVTVDGLEGFEHARQRGAGIGQAASEAGLNAWSQGFYDRAREGNWK